MAQNVPRKAQPSKVTRPLRSQADLHAELTPRIQSNRRLRKRTRELLKQSVPDARPDDVDMRAFYKQAHERTFRGYRWPALDSAPVFFRVTGDPWFVDTQPVADAMRELMWNARLGDEDTDAAVEVAEFLVKAILMGSATDRAIVRSMRDMARGLPQQRARAVEAVTFVVTRYEELPGDAERFPADSAQDFLDGLEFERVHAFAGAKGERWGDRLQKGHERIDRVLSVIGRARTKPLLGMHGHRGDAAAWVAKHGVRLPNPDEAAAFVKQREVASDALRAMDGTARHRLVMVCTTIEKLGRIDREFLNLNVEEVRALVAHAAKARRKGDGALGVTRLCARLCVRVGALGFSRHDEGSPEREKSEKSADTLLRRALAEARKRRA